MSRAALKSSPHVPSGLIDATGASIASAKPTVDIRTLPRIAADALPPLPCGIEARLLQDDTPAQNHAIVLWHDEHEVSVVVPLSAKADVPAAAARLFRAIARATRIAH